MAVKLTTHSAFFNNLLGGATSLKFLFDLACR